MWTMTWLMCGVFSQAGCAPQNWRVMAVLRFWVYIWRGWVRTTSVRWNLKPRISWIVREVVTTELGGLATAHWVHAVMYLVGLADMSHKTALHFPILLSDVCPSFQQAVGCWQLTFVWSVGDVIAWGLSSWLLQGSHCFLFVQCDPCCD